MCVVFLSFNARRLLVCVWAFFTYPVGWHDVALFLVLISLQCSISISNCCDHNVRISVKCRIGTDTGCAGRRRPTTVYHEEQSVETVGVIWVDDRFNLNITYQNHRRFICAVCGPAGSFMVRHIRLYDTIVNDTSFRPSTRISERCDLWLYIYIHLIPSGAIDYSSISTRCTYRRSCHHRVSYRYGIGCVPVLMSISFGLHS